MKRDDSVFFFTLIDFLVTALFFGLVLFAVERAVAERRSTEQAAKAAAVDSLIRASGVSNLTELTDELTRLGPLKEARHTIQEILKLGNLKTAQRAIVTVNRAGGVDSVNARLERLRLKEEGTGKPHCLFTQARGGREAIVLATLVGTDSTIAFVRETQHLSALLSRMGLSFTEVQSLKHSQFRTTFARVPQLDPTCLHTVEFIERTPYVTARDAVRGLFYMRITKE